MLDNYATGSHLDLKVFIITCDAHCLVTPQGQVVAELIKADMNGRKRSFVRMMCILAVLSIILSIAAPRFLASFLEKAIQAEG
eukprot:SAG31_NODE_1629_length_7702_cov_6.380902_4_plen_83_part_00